MQEVKCDKSRLDIFKEIEEVYRYTSVKDQSEGISVDLCFKPLFELFREYGNCNYHVEYKYVSRNWVKVKRPKNKTIVLCFSGGKDSVATALYYKKKGYDVYLYHLRGINQTYKDEYKAAMAAATHLNMPLTIEFISLSGSHDYTEHPMKNMVIANMALQWALDNELGCDIAFGNYTTSSIEDDPFDVCSGDDQEMWRAYENIIHKIIPNFRIHTVIPNMLVSFERISGHIDLLPTIQSCIGPFRYREYLHKENTQKYGVGLLPHRCGSCWKDAVEYIYFSDRKQLLYNEGFYKHCLEVLKKTLKREEGKRYKKLSDVYRVYFPDMIQNSLYFKEHPELV